MAQSVNINRIKLQISLLRFIPACAISALGLLLLNAAPIVVSVLTMGYVACVYLGVALAWTLVVVSLRCTVGLVSQACRSDGGAQGGVGYVGDTGLWCCVHPGHQDARRLFH